MTSKVILIANDQEWTARSLESVLAPHGYEILRAFTGQQALDRASAGQPALILLDAQLPDVHGFDVHDAGPDQRGEVGQGIGGFP